MSFSLRSVSGVLGLVRVGAAALVMFAGSAAVLADEPANAGAGGAGKVETPAASSTPAAAAAPAGAATTTAAAAASPKYAVCDVYKIADKMLQTPRYTKAMEEKTAELRAKMAPKAEEFEKLQQQLQGTPQDKQDSPEFKAGVEQYRKLNEELRAMDQEARNAMVAFIAEKNFEVYKQILASVDDIATKRGYTMVLNSRSIEDMEKPTSADAFFRGVLARPVVKASAADDLTLDVMKDLKLD